MVFSKSLAVAVAALAVSPLVHAFNAQSKSNVAVYYGQGYNQPRLSHFCQESALDIINIGFVNGFPDQSPANWPGSNFGNQCDGLTYEIGGVKTDLLSGCHQIMEDIPICQAAGKKVLLSIGGSTPDNQELLSTESAIGFAEFLWASFGPVDDTWVAWGGPRPFGNVSVDGFDFDIEHNGGFGYGAMVTRFRELFAGKPDQKFYLSGSPQCHIPDKQLSLAIATSAFDFVWVQFYNNDDCSARNFVTGEGFNFDAWVDIIKSGGNPAAKLFVGLPGSESAALDGYYLTPDEVKPLVKKYMKLYPDVFGGIMVWEATQSDRNQINGTSYAGHIKRILTELDPTPPAPTTSLSSSIIASSTPVRSSTPVISSTPTPSSTPVQSSSLVTSSTPLASSTPGHSSSPIASTTPIQSSTPVQSSTLIVSSSSARSSTPVQSSTPFRSSTPVHSSISAHSSTRIVSSSPVRSSTPVHSSATTHSSTPIISRSTVQSSALAHSSTTTASSTPASSSPLVHSSTPIQSSLPQSSSTTAQSSTPASSATISMPSVPGRSSTPATSRTQSASVITGHSSSQISSKSSLTSGMLTRSSSAVASRTTSASAILTETISPIPSGTPIHSGNTFSSAELTSPATSTPSTPPVTSGEPSLSISATVSENHSSIKPGVSTTSNPTGTPASSTVPAPSTASTSNSSSASTVNSNPTGQSSPTKSHAPHSATASSSAQAANPTTLTGSEPDNGNGTVTSTITSGIVTPSVTPTGTTSEPLTVTTVIVTSYIDICPTGFTTITTTYTTTYCPGTVSATATATNAPSEPGSQTAIPTPPEGWTSTVTVCTHCAPTPTTVTLTLPVTTTTVTVCTKCASTPTTLTLTVPATGAGAGSNPVNPTSTIPVGQTSSPSGHESSIEPMVTNTVISHSQSLSRTSSAIVGTGSVHLPSSTLAVRPSTSGSRVPMAPSETQDTVSPIFTGVASQPARLGHGAAALIALVVAVILLI
ncbi:glycoside hydrolase superfamily [Aspergillus pseudocaelatus]|uniref:chitinase n=1 Tax=Aspergillus pseudocaelatus TaxID=1825620 RepID=A0ABQ6WGV9_9EURO|nr:glycoside hydrolase superfamily [Aspergillus pseudocaelatus]